MFEGLFPPPHDKIVMELLFELATWHRLAKLRLHTESTIHSLETSTTWLGSSLHEFELVTCQVYDTKELPSEETAQGRQQAALAKKQGPSERAHHGHSAQDTALTKPKKRTRRQNFNISTYKLHALGDYAEAIQMNGTTDNYNTQLVRNEQVGFVNGKDPAAFGFLDPSDVIQGVHLIPAFAYYGWTAELLPPSALACAQSESNADWQCFYVSM